MRPAARKSAFRWFLRECAETLKWAGVAFGAPYFPALYRMTGHPAETQVSEAGRAGRAPMDWPCGLPGNEPFDVAAWEEKLR